MCRSFINALQTSDPLIRIMISSLSGFGVKLFFVKSAVFVGVSVVLFTDRAGRGQLKVLQRLWTGMKLRNETVLALQLKHGSCPRTGQVADPPPLIWLYPAPFWHQPGTTSQSLMQQDSSCVSVFVCFMSGCEFDKAHPRIVTVSKIKKAVWFQTKTDVLWALVPLASEKYATLIPSFITAAATDASGRGFSGVLTLSGNFLLKQAAAASQALWMIHEAACSLWKAPSL